MSTERKDVRSGERGGGLMRKRWGAKRDTDRGKQQCRRDNSNGTRKTGRMGRISMNEISQTPLSTRKL